MNINDVIKSKNPSVWVLNTSSKKVLTLNKPSKGDVIVPIRTSFGERVMVRVPSTWLPIDISLQAAKEDIQKSNSFRRMLSDGFLELLTEEEAKKILSSDDANAEQKRLEKEYSGRFTVDTFKGEKTDAEEHHIKPAEGDIERVDINLTVIDLFGREDITDEERRSNIRNIQDQLDENDWKYIMDNTKDEKTKELALSHLA